MKRIALGIGLAVLGGAAALGAEEPVAASRIESVGLFKNGLAVVRRVVTVPAPGTYRLDDLPEPVHGTFWVESGAPVEVQSTEREERVPVARAGGAIDFRTALAGQKVVIHLREGGLPPVSGRIEESDAPAERAWDRAYEQPDYSYAYSSGWRPHATDSAAMTGRYLVVRTETGLACLDVGQIALLRVEGDGGTVKRKRPVLLLTVPAGAEKPGPIHVSCMAKGMAWAPAYRVDLTDPKTLALEQQAVIKNELGPLSDAELHLISGFPSFQFAHVTSPLSMRASLASFFQQLGQRMRPGRSAAMTQQVTLNRAAPDAGLDLSALPTGEGPDIHYQSIGRRTLAAGDALSLRVVAAKAPYERIVEWVVPDTRDAHGRPVDRRDPGDEADPGEGEPQDAVRFKNPFEIPMTTAPALVVSGGRCLGQQMSGWSSPREETVVRITRALRIRTRSAEQEEGEKRRNLSYAGHSHHESTVKGELIVVNHRNEPVTLVIRRRFPGNLLEADENPACVLREEGVYSVNKRNELTWSLALKPGEEMKLSYRYIVLVRN